MAEFSEVREPILIEREMAVPAPCTRCGIPVAGFRLTGDIVGRVRDGEVSEPWKVEMSMTFENGRSEMLPCGCRWDGVAGEF